MLGDNLLKEMRNCEKMFIFKDYGLTYVKQG